MIKASNSFKTFIGPMLIIIFCWGLNFTVIKYALSEIEPIAFRGISAIIGAITIFVFTKNRRQFFDISRSEIRSIILYSFLAVTLFQSLSTYGIGLLPSGRASILVYTMPVWAVILSVFFLKETLTRHIMIGLVFGFFGILLLIGKEFTKIAGNPVGVIFTLLSAITWAFATIVFKRAKLTAPITTIAFWALFFGAIPLVALSFLLEEPIRPYSFSVWSAIFYNSIVVFVICHLAWFRVLNRIPANISSLATLGVPVVSVVAGFFILHEVPHWADIAGLVFILISLFTVLAYPQLPKNS